MPYISLAALLRSLLAPICMFISLCAFAQHDTLYSLSKVFPDSTEILGKVEGDFSAQWKEMSKEQELRQLYRRRKERFIAEFRGGRFVNDPGLNAYFDNLLDKIAASNPEWPVSEVRLFVARDPWPNASYVGYGYVVFNLGLLRRLENDGQVAFVLCHELAHYFMQHPERAMAKYAAWVSSKETKKKIKEIDRMEYGARTEALRFVRGMTFGSRRHSRYSESQADSLGLAMFRKAGFAPSGALGCMAVLDGCDKPKYTRDFAPESLFPHPAFPYRSEWLPQRKGLGMMAQDLDEEWADSLKTHPECGKRMAQIVQQLGDSDAAKGLVWAGSESDFMDLVKVADFNQVAAWWELDNVGRCMVAADRLRSEHPENLWLQATIGACFLKLYLAREAHTFGKYVERPSPEHQGDYKKWIKVLNAMRMAEFAQAGYHYLMAGLEAGRENERYWAAVLRLAEAAGFELNGENGAAAFQRKFPGSHWPDQIDRKLH